ncbi:response regulator [Pedobacter frigiditerrae]|uniref:Response regulator n=1 Tax=Pedobacter frigiditerrae TaxID=2530452 RepID=A0A4R0MMU2_9SPHI|nr:response regulator [Pedobacter frigiditerrae]TCC88045.1 response regulator [Pedobacter frigiditerrae]
MEQLDTAYVIDDDKIFTYALSRQMKLVNFSRSVMVFHNGLEALKHLTPAMASPEELPSLILLDLNMPVLDGWQFLDEFTKLRPNKKIRIYIVSSSIDPADHERALRYESVSNFYIKPISKTNLLEILSHMTLH